MNQTQKERRMKDLRFFLSMEKYYELYDCFTKSTQRSFSEFLRDLVSDKPLFELIRNGSMDDLMAELITLRNELSAIGRDFHEVVVKLRSESQLPGLLQYLAVSESHRDALLKKMEQINLKIAQLSDQWLQSSITEKVSRQP